jgi:hypothetical protein
LRFLVLLTQPRHKKRLNPKARKRESEIPKAHQTPWPRPRHDLRQEQRARFLPCGVASGRTAAHGVFPFLLARQRHAGGLVKDLAKGSQVTALQPAQARDALAALDKTLRFGLVAGLQALLLCI